MDCGSNLGQGFEWFAQFYSDPAVAFHLFEPNFNCHHVLQEVIEASGRNAILKPCGVSSHNAKVRFYGLAPEEGGSLSQGGTISDQHNSKYYKASEDSAIDIDVIDFSEYIVEQSRNFEDIVVKMDVEGAEIDILEKMIIYQTLSRISALYVEFHSQYLEPPRDQQVRAQEKAIVSALKRAGVRFEIWR